MFDIFVFKLLFAAPAGPGTCRGEFVAGEPPEGAGPESLDHFIRGCLGEPFYEGAGAEVGLQAVRTLDAMYRSARSGLPEPAL